MMGEAKHETRAVFTATVALSTPEERTRCLDEACQGKPELRKRVEALLRAHDRASHFLEINGPDPDSAREGPGTVIGRYKLLEEIGQGGFGLVYMAEQQEPVQRKVALKIIKAGMDTREVIARFEAERQALALMDHPNIARVLDAGATESGRPYFVMELVRGIPITNYCDQQQLPTAARLQLFMKVCQAVQHAHQKGVIHRDLKPTNILVTLIDGEAVPKVIDFGVAKALGHRLTEKTLFTAFQQMIGTPAYMSPEQAALSGVDVDTRSDIYSLGVLLYELLTGVTPFDQETFHQAALDEVRRMIRETEPPKPSTRLTVLARSQKSAVSGQKWKEVQGDLDWIVMKCLEKDRARRYETANSLADDIERHLKLEPVNAAAPSALYLTGKFVRRHKAGLATATALVLLLVAGVVVSTWQAVRATHAEREQTRLREAAETARQHADEQAAIAKAVNDFLQNDLLRQADGRAQTDAKFKADANLTVREALERASLRIGERFKDQPLTELAIRLAIGDALRGVGHEAQAVPHFLRAVELSQAKLGAEHLETLKCMDDLAAAYIDAGDPDHALPLLEKTLKLRTTKLGTSHPDTLTTMFNLGAAYELAGNLDHSALLLEKTLKLRKAKLGLDHPDTLRTMAALGETYHYAGKKKRALLIFEETLKLRKAKLGPDHPDTLSSINNLAAAYDEAGKPEEALRLYQENLQRELAMLGPDHPETLSTKHNLGSAYLAFGKLNQALPLLEEVLKTRRAVLGPDHLHTLMTMHWLAEAYQEAGRLDQAILLCDEAVQLARGKLGPDHFMTIRLMGDRACAYQKVGKLDQALPLHEQTASLAKAKLGPDDPYTLKSLGNLAWAYAAAGELERALPLLEETLNLEMAKLGPLHEYTLTTMNNLALAYQEAGKLDRALPLFEETFKLSKANFGQDHLNTRRAVRDLGGAYLEAGKLDQALPLLEEALKSRRAMLGREHPDTLIALANLGECRLRQGSYTNAEAMTRECFDLRQKTTPNDWRTFTVQTTLGMALLGQKKYADAEPMLVQGYGGLKERERDIPAGSRRQLTESVQSLVQLYDATGRVDQAAQWKQKLAEFEKTKTEKQPATPPR